MTAVATPEQLPPLLRDPPWTGGRRAPEPPRLELPPLASVARFTWTHEEREKARNLQPSRPDERPLSAEEEARLLEDLLVGPELQDAVRAGAALPVSHAMAPVARHQASFWDLSRLPAPYALALWNGVPASAWSCWVDDVVRFVGRHGDAAIPGVLAFARQHPVQGLRVGRWLDSADLATMALKALRRMKIARHHAVAWLLAHADTSAQVLLHQLVGNDDDGREDARAAVHDTALSALRPALSDAAKALGPAVAEALRAQLDADPLLRLPARMPKLPTFFDPAALHRPRLTGHGSALPDEAMRHLGLMLAISKADQPYAGLDGARAACTSASLAEFAWTLFEAWWAAGAPSQHAWCFAALAHLGDDTIAHRLGARAMRLAKEGAKNHAQTAVGMLADFGSDAALMHLNNLTERCKVPAVRNLAAAKIDAVAEARGLSRIELADRLVPTLGLDDSRVLDFGPRQFEIGFDEALVPFVRDSQRTRLKDLPKPRQSDDAAKAQAAALRWKQLKQDMKALARVQVARLEQAMIEQRRWSHDEFRRFFVDHPLVRELAARLLWAVLDAQGRVVDACRIAEDGTLADAQDGKWHPPDGVQFGIAHPLALPAALLESFKRVFADYEVLQPFPQLTRETFALTPAEAAASSLDRFDGRDVATGAVIHLIDRGWQRGSPQDGGMILWIERPLGGALVARLELEPGMFVAQLSGQPRQTLRKLAAFMPDDAPATAAVFGRPMKPAALAAADPILLSETLRDVHRLSPQIS